MKQNPTLTALVMGAAMYSMLKSKIKSPLRKEIEAQITYCLLLDCIIEDEHLSNEILSDDYFLIKVELEDAKRDLIEMVMRFF